MRLTDISNMNKKEIIERISNLSYESFKKTLFLNGEDKINWKLMNNSLQVFWESLKINSNIIDDVIRVLSNEVVSILELDRKDFKDEKEINKDIENYVKNERKRLVSGYQQISHFLTFLKDYLIEEIEVL